MTGFFSPMTLRSMIASLYLNRTAVRCLLLIGTTFLVVSCASTPVDRGPTLEQRADDLYSHAITGGSVNEIARYLELEHAHPEIASERKRARLLDRLEQFAKRAQTAKPFIILYRFSGTEDYLRQALPYADTIDNAADEEELVRTFPKEFVHLTDCKLKEKPLSRAASYLCRLSYHGRLFPVRCSLKVELPVRETVYKYRVFETDRVNRDSNLTTVVEAILEPGSTKTVSVEFPPLRFEPRSIFGTRVIQNIVGQPRIHEIELRDVDSNP